MRNASLLLVLLAGCDAPGVADPAPGEPDLPSPESFAREHGRFESYWHQGVAELSRYRLRQARYGEVHDGEAVLVFVTEPFLPDEQVKHEHGEHPEAIGVLKLNASRRFYTGIYPYSVLTSSFSPENGGPTLKVSTSVQEWCGHAYMQINRRDAHLALVGHSYFQDEVHQRAELDDVPVEDGVYATIRRDPEALPTGTLRMIPALHHLRFIHREVGPERAEATLDEADDERFGGRVRRYTIEYPELERTVRIYFGRDFPRAILGWEEDGHEGHTEAIRTHALLTDYWARHGADDGAYRDALGLTL